MKKLFLTLVAAVVTMVTFSQSTIPYVDLYNSNNSSVKYVNLYNNDQSSVKYSNLNTTYTTNNSNTELTYVNGYYNANGTYVAGYYKTKNNDTNLDNFSTQGNFNIFTGTTGDVPKDYSLESAIYSLDKTIHTGKNGGQYYINSNGNKTYVPKK